MIVKINKNYWKPGIFNVIKYSLLDIKNYGLFAFMACILENSLPVAGGNPMYKGDGCYYLDPINDVVEFY